MHFVPPSLGQANRGLGRKSQVAKLESIAFLMMRLRMRQKKDTRSHVSSDVV